MRVACIALLLACVALACSSAPRLASSPRPPRRSIALQPLPTPSIRRVVATPCLAPNTRSGIGGVREAYTGARVVGGGTYTAMQAWAWKGRVLA
jgi:hypothetical protein